MEWTKCEICEDHTSLGSYLFQIKAKKFPLKEAERVCILCGKAPVTLFPSYDALLDALTKPAR